MLNSNHGGFHTTVLKIDNLPFAINVCIGVANSLKSLWVYR